MICVFIYFCCCCCFRRASLVSFVWRSVLFADALHPNLIFRVVNWIAIAFCFSFPKFRQLCANESRKFTNFCDFFFPSPLLQQHTKLIKSSTPIKRLIDPISKNLYHRNHDNNNVGSLVHHHDRSNRHGCTTMNLEKIYPGIYLTSVKNLCSAESLKLFGFTHIIYIDKHIIVTKTAPTPATPSSSASSSTSPTATAMPTVTRSTHKNENIFGHSDFETLDLNFGESSYLTTVLPNCYKAVKFIETALKNNGAVLVIDCIGENQKCITIVVGFLMYKYNKNFL